MREEVREELRRRIDRLVDRVTYRWELLREQVPLLRSRQPEPDPMVLEATRRRILGLKGQETEGQPVLPKEPPVVAVEAGVPEPGHEEAAAPALRRPASPEEGRAGRAARAAVSTLRSALLRGGPLVAAAAVQCSRAARTAGTGALRAGRGLVHALVATVGHLPRRQRQEAPALAAEAVLAPSPTPKWDDGWSGGPSSEPTLGARVARESGRWGRVVLAWAALMVVAVLLVRGQAAIAGAPAGVLARLETARQEVALAVAPTLADLGHLIASATVGTRESVAQLPVVLGLRKERQVEPLPLAARAYRAQFGRSMDEDLKTNREEVERWLAAWEAGYAAGEEWAVTMARAAGK